MKRQHHTFLSLLLASSVALAACSSGADDAKSPPASAPVTTATAEAPTSDPETDPAPDSTEASAPSSGEVDGAVADAFAIDQIADQLGAAYASSLGKWSGFDMKNEPVVLAMKNDDGELIGALAINHPAPDELGDAVRLPDNADLGAAFIVENLTEETTKKLEPLNGFDFHMELGGIDSFAMIAGGGDWFFDPASLDYASTLIHEAFHRWQDRGFDGDLGDQDVDGYAYTAENIAMAALEERVLIAALATDVDADREALARQLAAIRLQRRVEDPRIRLDDNQERYEGTARWLEHAQAGTNTGFAYHSGNHGGELLSDPSSANGTKAHYGFGRFYASGAAIVEIAHRIGVENPTQQISDGASPIDLLIDFSGVSASDAAAVVAEAKAQHDPDEELPELAARAAESAVDEPGVFDDFGSTDQQGDSDLEGAVEVTDEQLECLADLGLDLDDPESGVTDEMLETCL